MPPDGGGGSTNAVAPYRAKARIQASFRQIGVDGRESMPSVGQMAACIVSGMTHMSIRHDAVPERLSSRPGAGTPGAHAGEGGGGSRAGCVRACPNLPLRRLDIQSPADGPPRIVAREPGQVRKEAAITESRKCRGFGSSPSYLAGTGCYRPCGASRLPVFPPGAPPWLRQGTRCSHFLPPAAIRCWPANGARATSIPWSDRTRSCARCATHSTTSGFTTPTCLPAPGAWARPPSPASWPRP